VLVSIFFSVTSTDPRVETGLAGGFIALTAVAGLAFHYSHRWSRLIAALHRLEDTSAQLRVRIAITMALAFGVAAQHFGLSTILGAFLAGVVVKMAHESDAKTFPVFESKLQAIGFGFLIPIFFVTTGAGLDLRPWQPARLPSWPSRSCSSRSSWCEACRRSCTGG
jgi:Kef-type K+ transport system membrane component KefB